MFSAKIRRMSRRRAKIAVKKKLHKVLLDNVVGMKYNQETLERIQQIVAGQLYGETQ